MKVDSGSEIWQFDFAFSTRLQGFVYGVTRIGDFSLIP